MEERNKKSTGFFKKNILPKGTNIYENIKKTSKVVSEENLNKTVSTIERSAQSGADMIKTNPHLQSLKKESLKIKKKGIKKGKLLKKQSPKIFEKIRQGFFYFFEAIAGRIKIGSQYGTPSLDLLERLAKLKELGILTEKEFQEKKTDILKRI
ncbi:MAG TPA: SHOCT domain-containing protein [Nitrosopumilaceae archaeon]|nr:SHOCT domain-containing protein [Nitrosopumilaceae archaeon]